MTTPTKTTMLALAALAITIPAYAQTTAPAGAPTAAAASQPNDSVQYSAFFDGYYAFQFNNPRVDGRYEAALAAEQRNASIPPQGSPVALPETLGNTIVRAYDDRQNTPTLALAEVNIFQAPRLGGLGFKTTLGGGDITDVNASGAPGSPARDTGEGRFKNILQAYGTWSVGSTGAELDFGKFYSPIGYEVTESNGNFNETHSIPFEMVPFYHFGVRANTPSYAGIVLTGYVVQAIYNTSKAGVQNDNGSASVVESGAWTDPKGRWVIVESAGFGKNKFNLDPAAGYDSTRNAVTVSDTDLTCNLDARHVLGLDYTYATTKPDSSPTPDSSRATDDGAALYYKQILNPRNDFAVRFSNGTFKTDGYTGGAVSIPSLDLHVWEATATCEFRETSNVTMRLEYQHANANLPEFADSNDILSKKSQDVVEVAELVSF
ncbi:MAG: outer membrane beta-barrel protein [Capsulimonadaceae bacterium]